MHYYLNEKEKIKHLVLEQPDYSNWGTDDQFIVNWTLQQLGLIRSGPNQWETDNFVSFLHKNFKIRS